jgi:hypothetical protein
MAHECPLVLCLTGATGALLPRCGSTLCAHDLTDAVRLHRRWHDRLGSTVTYHNMCTVPVGAQEWDLSQFEPVEVKAGALVLLHGCNVHYSAENTSPVSRHAYSIHVVESAATAWSPDNW